VYTTETDATEERQLTCGVSEQMSVVLSSMISQTFWPIWRTHLEDSVTRCHLLWVSFCIQWRRFCSKEHIFRRNFI